MTFKDIRRQRGRLARRDGRRSEWLCALILMAKGYRLLGFRLKTAQAEIDILAAKGGAVAVIEVKRRATLNEALEAVTPRQRQRLMAAPYTGRLAGYVKPGAREGTETTCRSPSPCR